MAVLFADVEDGNDVAVAKAGYCASFTREAFTKLFVVVAQELDGDLALEHRIQGEEEESHAALADAIEDLVPPDSGRHIGHGGLSSSSARFSCPLFVEPSGSL